MPKELKKLRQGKMIDGKVRKTGQGGLLRFVDHEPASLVERFKAMQGLYCSSPPSNTYADSTSEGGTRCGAHRVGRIAKNHLLEHHKRHDRQTKELAALSNVYTATLERLIDGSGSSDHAGECNDTGKAVCNKLSEGVSNASSAVELGIENSTNASADAQPAKVVEKQGQKAVRGVEHLQSACRELTPTFLRPADIERRPPVQRELPLLNDERAPDATCNPNDAARRVDAPGALRAGDIERRSAWFWGSSDFKGQAAAQKAVYWGRDIRVHDTLQESAQDDDSDLSDAPDDTSRPTQNVVVQGCGHNEGVIGEEEETGLAGMSADTGASDSPQPLPEPTEAVAALEEIDDSDITSDLKRCQHALERAMQAESQMTARLRAATVASAVEKAAATLTVASAQEASVAAAAVLFTIDKALANTLQPRVKRLLTVRRCWATEQFQSANAILARAITEEARVIRLGDDQRLACAVKVTELNDVTLERRTEAAQLAAAIIQYAVLRWLARRETERRRIVRKYSLRREAATRIQSVARGMLARRQYVFAMISLTKMQAVGRGWIARQSLYSPKKRRRNVIFVRSR